LSQIAERWAQKAVAVSFWLLAPYIAVEAIRDLIGGHRAETTVVGLVLAASSLFVMPALGYARRRLGARLGSARLGRHRRRGCAELPVRRPGRRRAHWPWGQRRWPSGWWLDPVIGLGIAAWSVWEGIESWRGEDCC
jgi:divalent metal cation (Fe/Co/Zn/Cd) transporter